MFESIMLAILGLIKAIPIFDKWFTKPVTQKIEDKKEDLAKEMEDFKKTGRPQ